MLLKLWKIIVGVRSPCVRIGERQICYCGHCMMLSQPRDIFIKASPAAQRDMLEQIKRATAAA